MPDKETIRLLKEEINYWKQKYEELLNPKMPKVIEGL